MKDIHIDMWYGDDISWSDDWEATDCYEDDSLSDDMYIKKDDF